MRRERYITDAALQRLYDRWRHRRAVKEVDDVVTQAKILWKTFVVLLKRLLDEAR